MHPIAEVAIQKAGQVLVRGGMRLLNSVIFAYFAVYIAAPVAEYIINTITQNTTIPRLAIFTEINYLEGVFPEIAENFSKYVSPEATETLFGDQNLNIEQANMQFLITILWTMSLFITFGDALWNLVVMIGICLRYFLRKVPFFILTGNLKGVLSKGSQYRPDRNTLK